MMWIVASRVALCQGKLKPKAECFVDITKTMINLQKCTDLSRFSPSAEKERPEEQLQSLQIPSSFKKCG
jgi:hypothetical protein